MAYELVVLPREWVFGAHGGFQSLAKIINKGYSKPIHKYNVILSPRIREPETFVADFTPKKYVSLHIVLLLGPETVFSQLEADGYVRDFDRPNDSLEAAFSCDIPEKYRGLFNLNENVPVKVTEASSDYVLTPDVLYRVLATAGVKAFAEDLGVPHVRPFELSTFTSYMRGSGPVVLELLIKHVFTNKNIYDLLAAEKVVLYADVIKEHQLVEYYVSKCGFKMTEREDVKVLLNPEGGLKDSTSSFRATRDFHLALLAREIEVVA